MTLPLLAGLALFFVYTALPGSLRYGQSDLSNVDKLKSALGPRDDLPKASAMAERAGRALANYQETLPAFIALCLLHEVQGADAYAPALAWLFVVLRGLYLPAYLSGVPGVRSGVWTLAGTALVGMAALLFIDL